MNGIVYGAIYKVADDKAGEEGERIVAHDQVHQPENQRSDDKTGNGRH